MILSLSTYEQQLVADAEVLLAKNRIIQKVYDLFGEIAENYKQQWEAKSLQDYFTGNAKISKGENYQGLPYVMLDFPRQFGKQDILAIRSFFWWGNFFSITVHLSGSYQQLFTPVIQNAIDNRKFHGWYKGQSADQWQHHFQADNYLPIDDNILSGLHGMPFLKLAKKIPLQAWDEAYEFFTENFKMLTEMLGSYAPMR